MPDGRSLWLYGDTYTKTKGFLRNSAAIWDPRSGSYEFLSGSDSSGFLDRSEPFDVAWYWPGTPLVDGNSVLIPGVLINKCVPGCTPGGPFGFFEFRSMGTDLLEYSYLGGRFQFVGTQSFPVDDVMWGASSVEYRGVKYFYGAVAKNPNIIFLSRLDDSGRIKVWTKMGWRSNSSLEDLKRVGSRLSVSFTTIVKKNIIYAIARTNEFEPNIDVYKTRSITGVFKRQRTVAVSSSGAPGYWAQAHPQLPAPKGKFWVTTNNNGEGVYRPSWKLVSYTGLR